MSGQFFFGFICGGALGAWVTWLAFDWLHPEVRIQERETLFPMSARRSCPPCTHDCAQGHDCGFDKKN